MVVSANMARFTHAVTGKFGKDEPWPEWSDPHGLQRDFGIEHTEDDQQPLANTGLCLGKMGAHIWCAPVVT